MNRRDEFNYERYHGRGQSLATGVKQYWQDQTCEVWRDGEYFDQERSLLAEIRWTGIEPMYSRNWWRKVGAVYPDERAARR